MNFKTKLSLAFLTASMASIAVAQPLPNVLIQDEKAVVPVTKTQIIRTVQGQAPVRTTEVTVLEMKNKGLDIVARDLKKVEEVGDFAEEKMAIPRVQEKSAIVPTSKIEEVTTVTREGEVISQVNKIDATGVEFKKGKEPVRKELKVGSVELPEGRVSRAVVSQEGKTTKDVTVVRPAAE